ncbi:MAG TPA: condensation domain-containing protein [Gaiellaceae bacterium]|nr:condensation domain-containing protein [Gaiellaceae bacterium]
MEAAKLTSERRPVGVVGSWGVLTQGEKRESEQSIPAAFAARVASSRDALAIEERGRTVTFDELDRRSNQVAAGILAEASSDGAVGLLVGDLVPYLVALMGALKAGRIALPLDPNLPEAALARTLGAARAGLVIGEPTGTPSPVRLRKLGDYAREQEAPSEIEIEPGRSALLAFTSGSTGEPRGHVRTHRMMVHHALRDGTNMGIRPGTRVGMVLSPVFSRMLPLRVLISGATLLRYEAAALGLGGLASWLTENRIEATSLMASMADPILAGMGPEGLPTLRMVGLGGERVGRARAEALRQALSGDGRLVHSYASTEGSHICSQPIEEPIRVDDSPLPVGFSLPGCSVWLLDEDGNPAETGEIVVESSYLARPWDPDEDTTLAPVSQVFHTRDRGAVDDDGRLSILGRVDRMAKIRGFRVQLDAVEAALNGLPAVHAAAVAAEPSPRGTQRIVAYVALDSPREPADPAGLKQQLANVLPPYMVPSRIVEVDELPLLSNGKVDLRAIAEGPPTRLVAPPLGSTEELVAGIWADVLELDSVGRSDDFLELGGDSLSAAIVVAQIFKALGVELDANALERSPTVAAMAAAIEGMRADPPRRRGRPLRAGPHSGRVPLTVVQEGYWHEGLTPGQGTLHNLANSVELRGDLDAGALERAIGEIVRRHEVLRTTFSERRGRIVQIVHPAPFLDWSVVDLRSEADPAAAAAGLLAREKATPFDLERGPLARFRLLLTGTNTHELVRTIHHLVFDGWSSVVFYRELAALYAAEIEGGDPPLDELQLQYRDYTVWERARVRRRSPFFWSELAWWRRRLTPPPEAVRFPFLRPAPIEDLPPTEGVLVRPLPPRLTEALDRVERECHASYFVVRLAAFSAHLLETTGSRDLALGVIVSARRVAELQAMIGLLANLTLLRLRLGGTPTFNEWVVHVRDAVAEAGEHFAIPYGAFPWAFRGVPIGVPGLDLIVAGERAPQPSQTVSIPRLELREPDRPGPPPAGMPRKFDVYFAGRAGKAEHEQLRLKFDASRYDPVLVHAFLDGFERAVAGLCEHPDEPLGIVGAAER